MVRVVLAVAFVGSWVWAQPIDVSKLKPKTISKAEAAQELYEIQVTKAYQVLSKMDFSEKGAVCLAVGEAFGFASWAADWQRGVWVSETTFQSFKGPLELPDLKERLSRKVQVTPPGKAAFTVLSKHGLLQFARAALLEAKALCVGKVQEMAMVKEQVAFAVEMLKLTEDYQANLPPEGTPMAELSDEDVEL